MIVAHIDFDAQMQVLSTVAQDLISYAGSTVSQSLAPPNQSTAGNIQAALAGSADAFFFFGHGDGVALCLVGQDQQSAVGSTNDYLLRDRLVCATCCFGISVLDSAVQNQGATVLGYDGELHVLLKSPYTEYMKDCLLAGLKAIVDGQTVSNARQIIENEFRTVAQTLQSSTIFREQLLSVFFNENADRVKISGPDRTL